MSTSLINYLYIHQETESTTGYFDCRPEPAPALADLPALLAARPLDSFLRRHAISRFAALGPEELEAAWQLPSQATGKIDAEGLAALRAFIRELGLIVPGLAAKAEELDGRMDAGWARLSPLLYLRRAALPDAELQAAWAALFTENIHGHRKLPAPDELAGRGLPPLYSENVLERFGRGPFVSLKDLPPVERAGQAEALMPAGDVAELALERLQSAGAVAGPEQRHIASLSPIGLLMPWRLNISVADGRNNYTLSGQANTYGRGLSLPQARASCRMEMVERFSAYLSIKDGAVQDRAVETPLLWATRSEIVERGEHAIDPDDFYVEAPYQDERLVWISGLELRHEPGVEQAVERRVWVPLQMVALFSNCDEVDLASAPGSTGIATGSTMEMARLAALTEIMERDAEATTVYSKSRCFQLDPGSVNDETLAALLHYYRALGINVQFMDMTGPYGLPCYQAFVIGPRGTIYRGHGASLSGPRALVSALTETPYPYPEGGASGPMLRKLPVRGLSELPDYTSGSLKNDLALLEKMLGANGLYPIYVDLTHAGLKFPVVRALVPGLQLSADFDEFTRLSPRLYQNYLESFQR